MTLPKGVTPDYHFSCTIDTPEAERRKMNMGDIYSNQAKCLSCNEVIRSKNRHDYVTCSCGKLSVDGGSWYLKRSGDFKNSLEMSILFTDAQAKVDRRDTSEVEPVEAVAPQDDNKLTDAQFWKSAQVVASTLTQEQLKVALQFVIGLHSHLEDTIKKD